MYYWYDEINETENVGYCGTERTEREIIQNFGKELVGYKHTNNDRKKCLRGI
jgi:hypothetical protein